MLVSKIIADNGKSDIGSDEQAVIDQTNLDDDVLLNATNGLNITENENDLQEIYESQDFLNAFHHFEPDPTKVPVDQWLTRTLIAVFLLKCLQSSQFFQR